MKIWCLFSIDNNYDQPGHNLVGWFQQKPTVHKLAELLKIDFATATQEQILFVTGVWQGNDVRYGETNYRIEEVGEFANLST
ncbi:hypothetical protein UFOVP1193_32 [uncultured Caudovirales phage]|uniref:Uncharacterized protein n=1 Tax=uncultured Caudovirales phage TaxID=2100421 RepID=A0A6J5QZE2_9CAUD|nr:hypothetical protein UFOVP1193_32 [uncultured Caudovirales phage]